MTSERTHYQEFSRWPTFVWVILWCVVVLTCFPILAGWGHELGAVARWLLVGGIVGATWAISLLLGGLSVQVQESRVVVHLGRVPLVRKVIPFDEIVSTRSVRYRPIMEFGGWGVRGFGKRRAWTARGNRAVALQLRGDRELLIGSDQPQRLEERIRTFAGGRIGRTKLPPGSPR